jgi:hypothetical protein
MPGLPIGIKLWYPGTTVVINAGEIGTRWVTAPVADLQIVAVFFDAQYQIIKQDGYDEQGQPINQRIETENYIQLFLSTEGGTIDLDTGQVITREVPSLNFMWVDLRGGKKSLGAGSLADVPNGLQAGFIKTGSLIADDQFYLLARAAQNDRKWP